MSSSSKPLEERITKPSTNTNDADWEDVPDNETQPSKTTNLPESQTDGATDAQGGSTLHEPEYDVQVKLSDMQADPNNPLFSAKAFEDLGLTPEILKGIFSMNFRKPSKIQERALPLLLANPPTNMIGQSQSGTGKTAAFVLNILARTNIAEPRPQALVLAPSRELARQIVGVIQTMGQFLEGLQVVQAIPDPARRGQQIQGHVAVGTPGTVMDLIRRRLLDPSQIKVVVLDEADNMLDQQGLGEQCTRVKMYALNLFFLFLLLHFPLHPTHLLTPLFAPHRLLPKTVQVVLFSATFPTFVIHYADKFAPNANQLTLKHEELTVEGIRQLFMDCDNEQHKYECLVRLYGLMTIGSSIIFVKRRETAAEIERRMTAEGHHVAQLTGGLEGAARDAVIDKFRSGSAKVLVTTNVLARGIDVQSVSMVVNYDVPDKDNRPDAETYLHRIGRTGRFGRVGVAISFVYDKRSFEMLLAIVRHFGCEPEKLATDDWDAVEEKIKSVIKSSRAGGNMRMDQ